MQQFKQDIADRIVAKSVDYREISLREVAAELGYNHISQHDVLDIIHAVKKVLPEYRPIKMMDTPYDSLFVSLVFTMNEYDDGEEYDD